MANRRPSSQLAGCQRPNCRPWRLMRHIESSCPLGRPLVQPNSGDDVRAQRAVAFADGDRAAGVGRPSPPFGGPRQAGAWLVPHPAGTGPRSMGTMRVSDTSAPPWLAATLDGRWSRTDITSLAQESESVGRPVPMAGRVRVGVGCRMTTEECNVDGSR